MHIETMELDFFKVGGIECYAIHLSSLVQQGTTSLALMLVRVEASPTTGATPALLGTTAVPLVMSSCR